MQHEEDEDFECPLIQRIGNKVAFMMDKERFREIATALLLEMEREDEHFEKTDPSSSDSPPPSSNSYDRNKSDSRKRENVRAGETSEKKSYLDKIAYSTDADNSDDIRASYLQDSSDSQGSVKGNTIMEFVNENSRLENSNFGEVDRTEDAHKASFENDVSKSAMSIANVSEVADWNLVEEMEQVSFNIASEVRDKRKDLDDSNVISQFGNFSNNQNGRTVTDLDNGYKCRESTSSNNDSEKTPRKISEISTTSRKCLENNRFVFSNVAATCFTCKNSDRTGVPENSSSFMKTPIAKGSIMCQIDYNRHNLNISGKRPLKSSYKKKTVDENKSDKTDLQFTSASMRNYNEEINTHNDSIQSTLTRNCLGFGSIWPEIHPFTEIEAIQIEEIESDLRPEVATKYLKLELSNECVIVRISADNQNISVNAVKYTGSSTPNDTANALENTSSDTLSDKDLNETMESTKHANSETLQNSSVEEDVSHLLESSKGQDMKSEEKGEEIVPTRQLVSIMETTAKISADNQNISVNAVKYTGSSTPNDTANALENTSSDTLSDKDLNATMESTKHANSETLQNSSVEEDVSHLLESSKGQDMKSEEKGEEIVPTLQLVSIMETTAKIELELQVKVVGNSQLASTNEHLKYEGSEDVSEIQKKTALLHELEALEDSDSGSDFEEYSITTGGTTKAAIGACVAKFLHSTMSEEKQSEAISPNIKNASESSDNENKSDRVSWSGVIEDNIRKHFEDGMPLLENLEPAESSGINSSVETAEHVCERSESRSSINFLKSRRVSCEDSIPKKQLHGNRVESGENSDLEIDLRESPRKCIPDDAEKSSEASPTADERSHESLESGSHQKTQSPEDESNDRMDESANIVSSEDIVCRGERENFTDETLGDNSLLLKESFNMDAESNCPDTTIIIEDGEDRSSEDATKISLENFAVESDSVEKVENSSYMRSEEQSSKHAKNISLKKVPSENGECDAQINAESGSSEVKSTEDGVSGSSEKIDGKNSPAEVVAFEEGSDDRESDLSEMEPHEDGVGGSKINGKSENVSFEEEGSENGESDLSEVKSPEDRVGGSPEINRKICCLKDITLEEGKEINEEGGLPEAIFSDHGESAVSKKVSTEIVGTDSQVNKTERSATENAESEFPAECHPDNEKLPEHVGEKEQIKRTGNISSNANDKKVNETASEDDFMESDGSKSVEGSSDTDNTRNKSGFSKSVSNTRNKRKNKTGADVVDAAPTRARRRNMGSDLSKKVIPEHPLIGMKGETEVRSSNLNNGSSRVEKQSSQTLRSLRGKSLDTTPIKSRPFLDTKSNSVATGSASEITDASARRKRAVTPEIRMKSDIRVASRSSPRKATRVTASNSADTSSTSSAPTTRSAAVSKISTKGSSGTDALPSVSTRRTKRGT